MVIRRILLTALALLVLGACSFTRVAYDHAPPILAWMVDDYFDLTNQQRHWVEERFERAMAWHRAQELPQYRQFFESAIARSADGISVEDARWAQEHFRSAYRRSLERLVPDMADFLGRLDGEQVSALEKKLAEENAKIEKEASRAAGKRSSRRAERFIDPFEGWTGRLSASQRDYVATQVAGLEDLTPYRMADRRRRQAEILQLLRSRPAREAMLPVLGRVVLDPGVGRDPVYAAKLQARDEQVYRMVAELDATLSPEQRAHMVKRARGYLSDITALAAKAGP